MKKLCLSLAAFLIVATYVLANDGAKEPRPGFVVGTPEITSIKTLAFGPDGLLFLGDNDAMKIYALEVNVSFSRPGTEGISIKGIDKKLADKLGVDASEVSIVDMAVRPGYGNIFLSTSVERQGKSYYTLFMLGAQGEISEVNLENISYSETGITDAPGADASLWRKKSRTYTFTDMAFIDGELIVAGLSNQEFASSLRRIPFPFQSAYSTTGLQVYHVSHGKNETHAPIYRFMPYQYNNQKYIIAGYLCTPLVRFSFDDLKQGKKLVGTTIAELGAGNGPQGIVSYDYKGKNYILVGNNRHPLMKFEPKEIVSAKPLTHPTRDRGVARTTFSEGSIRFLFDYSDDHLILVNKESDESLTLRTLAKSEL